MHTQNKKKGLMVPRHIRLEASTACQLKCPSCPTATGEIARQLNVGYLKLADFKKIVDANPQLESIELSNWGELFLNRDIVSILGYADERGVVLTAGNGANLNTMKPGVLEAIVKYKLRFLNVSIDGASQASYSIYRVNGNWDTVVRNIKEINRWKRHYQSEFPVLMWQFVAFGHNEHEIGKARSLAEELDMRFILKLSWGGMHDRAFSPVRDRALVRRESGLGVADRAEFREKYGKGYLGHSICLDMWHEPQINFDGRLLGCACNYWGDYGNVFEQGLKETFNSEKLEYARQMLMGRTGAREGVPCTSCQFYAENKKYDDWVPESETLAKEGGYIFEHSCDENEDVIHGNGYALPLSNMARAQNPWQPTILFRGATATADFMQCHVSSLVQGHIPHPPHAHGEEELLIMLSGAADLILPDGEHALRQQVKRGDFVFYPAYFKHTLQATSEDPANYLMFKWESKTTMLGDVLAYKHFKTLDVLEHASSQTGFSAWVLFEGKSKYMAKLHCHVSLLKPGGGYAAHADEYDVAIILLEGEVETLGKRFQPNSLIYYAKGELHGMHNPGDVAAKYIVFEFHRD